MEVDSMPPISNTKPARKPRTKVPKDGSQEKKTKAKTSAKTGSGKSKKSSKGPKGPKIRIKRRDIIKGKKSAWIGFCNAHRDSLVKENPGLAFGEVCKLLAPKWTALNEMEKKVYIDAEMEDKQRFNNDMANLTPEQKTKLRQYRKQIRMKRSQLPRSPHSAYIYFVMDHYKKTTVENPAAKFEEIGKILGDKWKVMSAEDRVPYVTRTRQEKEQRNSLLAKMKQDRAAKRAKANLKSDLE
jgi:hypothetical protein